VSTSFPAFRRRAVPALAALASAAAVGGCGSSSGSGVSVPTIGAAKVFTLAGFQPSAPVLPGSARPPMRMGGKRMPDLSRPEHAPVFV
jgi:hypothetical protein